MNDRNNFPIASRILSLAGIILLLLALLPLAYSVARSGLGYMYDADEIARVQESYLIATGYLPYRDFYMLYSPVFQIFILPMLYAQGFTFAAIDSIRLVMVVLFFLRVGATAYIAQLLFGRRTALLFSLFFLLDPFTVFTSMQIRPDNFMMTVLVVGLVFLIKSLQKQQTRFAYISGGLLALAFIIMVKSFLTIALVGAIFLFYTWKTKKMALLKAFVTGGVLTVIVYLLPFILTGTLGAMLQQSVVDPKAFQSSQDYPTPLGYFYSAGNWNLYGSGGRSATWIFAWVLPVLGFAGAYQAFIRYLNSRDKTPASVIVPALAFSLALQWVLLFTLHTVLLQYYIPVLWLFALFAGFALDRLIAALDVYPKWRMGFVAVSLGVFLLLAQDGYKANLFRSKLDSHDFIQLMNRVWAQIPQKAKVFPMTLFRPPGFPVPEAGFAGVHANLLSRYDPVEVYLDKDQVPFVLASDYTLGYLKTETQAYIRANYAETNAGLDLMVRKDSLIQSEGTR